MNCGAEKIGVANTNISTLLLKAFAVAHIYTSGTDSV